MSEPLWAPSAEEVERAGLTRFAAFVRARHGVEAPDYAALHAWSVAEPAAFWDSVWEHCGVVAAAKGGTVLEDADRMPGARWFPGARLNFAENLLRRRDDGPAIVFRGEVPSAGTDRIDDRRISWRQLHDHVSRAAQGLRAAGVGPGDRVAGYLPNLPETVISMLAATSLGAVWSSCSPDFGVQGVLDRFGQIRPKVLVGADGYRYNGAPIDSLGRIRDVLAGVPSVERTVIVPYLRRAPDLRSVPGAITWDELTLAHRAREIAFEPVAFDHPLYIMYSSGTTGVPKCIVHGTGGTLLQHLKEHRLHADVHPGDTLFYFTTCGWMMWNWLVSGLGCGACLALYEGSPGWPDMRALFDFADAARIDIFGTSAKYLDAVKKSGLRPRETHDLSSVRAILSTGSPLVPETFDFVYEAVKPDVRLSSITGGTDIIGCFAQGNPATPVRRGEIQCLALGMQVEVFDEAGRPLPAGEPGELVCTAPFPSMPVGFWNDPDGAKYRGAYFERFPGVWHHGDWVEHTPPRRSRRPRALRRGPQPGRGPDRHGRDLPPGRAARRGAGEHRHRAGLGGRRAGGPLRAPAPGTRPRRRPRGPDPPPDPRQRDPPPRAGPDPRGRGHPADPERQDRRARGARHRPRAPGPQPRGARQPGGARALRRPSRALGLARLRLGPTRHV